MDALDLIRARVRACEADGVAILCCPEAILGGLADQIEDPARLAISARTGQLEAVLAPFASDVTTTIVGFTELGEDGCLYNAAAVFHRGSGRWQISTGGANMSVWSRRTSQLFYTSADSRLMVVDYSVAGKTFTARSRACGRRRRC